MIESYNNMHPTIDKTAKIFANCSIIGNVTLGKHVGVWYNSVIRGDMAKVIIGDYTNIQDGTIIHTNVGMPTIIGNHVTVGHNAIIHAATVHDEALIGMGSIILDQAEVGKNALVAAGTVVPPGKVIPPKTLVMGNPMKVIRTLKDKEIEAILKNKDHYVRLLKEYT